VNWLDRPRRNRSRCFVALDGANDGIGWVPRPGTDFVRSIVFGSRTGA